jgi:hypothetical protein
MGIYGRLSSNVAEDAMARDFPPGLLTGLAFRHHGHNLMPDTCALLSDSRQNLSIFGHDADVTKNRWGGASMSALGR